MLNPEEEKKKLIPITLNLNNYQLENSFLQPTNCAKIAPLYNQSIIN